jgi:hypothetical protein
LSRLAFAGGLLLASWVLATILSATASADELPCGASNGAASFGETGTTPPPAKVEAPRKSKGANKPEARQTSKQGKAKTPEPQTFVPQSPGISAPGKATTQGTPPAEPWPSTTSQAPQSATTPPSKAAVPKKDATQQPAGDAGLLGGLVGSLVTTVGYTVNTVTGTVGGLVDTVSHTVLQPVSGGPGALPLPIIGGLLPGLGSSDCANWPICGTVTIAVPAKLPAKATTPTGSQPGAPQPAAPVSDASAAVNRVTTGFTVAVRRAAYQHAAVDEPAASDKHLASLAGGSSGGGRNLPVTPSSPIAPTNVTAGHDGSGGARQQNAVLGSSANTTQLRLIGTSLDREVDGAGRDEALPTTSPD